MGSRLFQTSEHIACYLPRPFEFDTLAIIQAIWHANKKCYIPLLPLNDSKILNFALYTATSDLTLNQYQIAEPVTTEFFPAAALDLVLMPAAGFDISGNRLGSGGGYYDRTFAFTKTAFKKPVLIGLGYQLQLTKDLPTDEWDVLLDGIVTETGLFTCR